MTASPPCLTCPPAMPAPPKVVAVVVTYNPDWAVLRAQTLSLLAQVSTVLWIDNASSTPLSGLATELGVRLVRLPENRGIAFAHNHGVMWALEQSASFVLLMDHDSLPAPDMVAQLLSVMAAHADAAAVGPCYADPRSTQASHPFVWIEGLHLQRLERQGQDKSVPVDHLIASGCLIRAEAWRCVGPMLEPLFIDFVDVEWCLRARAQGWRLYGAWDAGMSHTIGHDLTRRMGRAFRIHSPLRHYYHVRNGLYLYQQAWIPLNWRWVSGWRMALKIGFYVAFGQNRWAYVRSTFNGVRDGLRWSLEPLPRSSPPSSQEIKS
jgi:rhamnosyltransferase